MVKKHANHKASCNGSNCDELLSEKKKIEHASRLCRLMSIEKLKELSL